MSGHMDETCDQAVVMGSSMAGLLAARVLSERFERVVVIERDPLPPIGEHRRGVPQAGTCTACTRAAARSSMSCFPASPKR